MSDRAYRLCQYLEKRLGWNIFSDDLPAMICQGCGTFITTNFCPDCGMRNVADLSKDGVVDEVELALKYALGEQDGK